MVWTYIIAVFIFFTSIEGVNDRRVEVSVPAAGAPSDATSVGRQTPSNNIDVPLSAAHIALDSIEEKTARTDRTSTDKTENATTMSAAVVANNGTAMKLPGDATEQQNGNSPFNRTASCADIHIGLETDNGETIPIEIDQAEEENAVKAEPVQENTGKACTYIHVSYG